MRNHAIHNTIEIRTTNFSDQYSLNWVDKDGYASEHICYVFGFENAVRVANGIAHEQCEFVKHPCFDPNLDPDDIAELQSAMQENADERYQLPH